MIHKFMSICEAYPIDYNELKTMLRNGFDINCEIEDPLEGKSILSNITMDWCYEEVLDENEKGYAFYELVKFFVDHGFDVKKYGGECLHTLCWANVGKYTLNIAELLLDHGADTTEKCEEDDTSGLLDAIDWKLDDWVVGNGRTANLMTPYYLMVQAYEAGENYHGFRAFESCIGEKITQIEKVAFTDQDKRFNEEHKNAFSGSIIFWCGDTPMVLTRYGELYVDPCIRDQVISTIDVSEAYSEILELRIKDLKYIDGNQGIGLLTFQDGDNELLFHRVLKHDENSGYVFFNIINSGNRSNIEISNILELYFCSGRTYSPYVKRYDEKFTVIKCMDTSYLIYSEGEYDENHRIRIVNVNRWFDHGMFRRVELKEPCLKGYISNEDFTIKAIVIDTFEGRLIFQTDLFDEMNVVFVDKDENISVRDNFLKGQYQLPFEEIELE